MPPPPEKFSGGLFPAEPKIVPHLPIYPTHSTTLLHAPPYLRHHNTTTFTPSSSSSRYHLHHHTETTTIVTPAAPLYCRDATTTTATPGVFGTAGNTRKKGFGFWVGLAAGTAAGTAGMAGDNHPHRSASGFMTAARLRSV
ncbi:hypothetical protein Tco_0337832 [Tanacetum coccineum]